MVKKIKEMTTAEINRFCDERREQNKTNKPYNACATCPLRWARQCAASEPFMTQSLITRMYKAIGDNLVEV